MGTVVYSGSATYGYDASGQLTSEQRSSGTESFSYDPAGTRNMSGYQAGVSNRVSTDGVWTYTYDDEGNLTQKSKGTGLETWSFSYDHRNLLTRLRQTSDGSTNLLLATYGYDAQARRVQEDRWTSATGTVTTRFAHDGGEAWAELDGSNALRQRWFTGLSGGHKLARIDGSGNRAWLLGDLQGSVRDVANGSSALVDHVDHSAFGKILTEASASAGGVLYWGGLRVDRGAGLYLSATRPYDPVQGVWLGEDSAGFGAGDANLRRLLYNDPLGGTDPSGQGLLVLAALYIPGVADGVVWAYDKATFGLSTDLINSRFFGQAVDSTDAFFAGWSSALTFGGTDHLRELIAGEAATRNHSGWFYNIGMGVGIVHSFAMGFGAGRVVPQGAMWAVRAARWYNGGSTAVGIGKSGYKAATNPGSLSGWDALPFLPVAGRGLGRLKGRFKFASAGQTPGTKPRAGDLGSTFPGDPVFTKHDSGWLRWLPGKWKLSYPNANYHIKPGLTKAVREGVERHELRHMSDIAKHPWIVRWSNGLLPGRGIVRYALEYRGYSAEAGKRWIYPWTPLKSFDIVDHLFFATEIVVVPGVIGLAVTSRRDR